MGRIVWGPLHACGVLWVCRGMGVHTDTVNDDDAVGEDYGVFCLSAEHSSATHRRGKILPASYLPENTTSTEELYVLTTASGSWCSLD